MRRGFSPRKDAVRFRRGPWTRSVSSTPGRRSGLLGQKLWGWVSLRFQAVPGDSDAQTYGCRAWSLFLFPPPLHVPSASVSGGGSTSASSLFAQVFVPLDIVSHFLQMEKIISSPLHWELQVLVCVFTSTGFSPSACHPFAMS